jgi:hypothetical protein
MLRGEAELVGELQYMRRPWITVELTGLGEAHATAGKQIRDIVYRREICHVWSVVRISRRRADLADRHNDPQPAVGASVALATQCFDHLARL